MAGVYQAGTVYVDVVPSMRGFFKSIENATATQLPQVAGDAGKKYAEKFKEQVSASGKDLVNAIADPLGKSTARLRQEAAQMGSALQEAHAQVAKSASALAKARGEEETAATAVERAERALAAARSSSSADSAQHVPVLPLTRRLSLARSRLWPRRVKRRRQRTGRPTRPRLTTRTR